MKEEHDPELFVSLIISEDIPDDSFSKAEIYVNEENGHTTLYFKKEKSAPHCINEVQSEN